MKNPNQRDERIAAAAAEAAAHFNGGKGFANTDRLNLYQCDANPSHLIVTIDREPGVTPFTVPCAQCAAKIGKLPGRRPLMASAMYYVHPRLTPTHEWYRPDELDGLGLGAVDHVLRGGLLLREIAPPGAEAEGG